MHAASQPSPLRYQYSFVPSKSTKVFDDSPWRCINGILETVASLIERKINTQTKTYLRQILTMLDGEPGMEEYTTIHLPSMDQIGWSERTKPKALIKSTPTAISGRSRAVKVTYEGRKGMVTRPAISRGGLSIQGNKSGGYPISSQQKTCFFCGKGITPTSTRSSLVDPLYLRIQHRFAH